MKALEIQIMKNKFESDEEINQLKVDNNQLKESLKKAEDKMNKLEENKFESDEELKQVKERLKKAEDKMTKMQGNFIEGLQHMRDSIFKRFDGFETVIKETGK